MPSGRTLSTALLLPLLAACAGDRGIAPAAGPPQLDVTGAALTLACDANVNRSAAQAFLANGNDPVFALLRDQAKAYGDGDVALATSLGFDALTEIALARGTSRQAGTGVHGDALTQGIVGCMDVGPVPDDFSVVQAIDRGIFEVRGGGVGGPAMAFAANPGSRVYPDPAWGIEASVGWDAEFADEATRYLVYGHPRAVGGFSGEEPSVDPNDVAYTGFDIATLPATPGLALDAPLRPAICVETQDDGVSNRLLHLRDEGPTVLALSFAEFCVHPGPHPHPVFGAAALGRRLLDLLAPRPAYAFFHSGVGGLTSSLSPFGPVRVDMTTAGFTYTEQPTPPGAKKASKIGLEKPFVIETRLTTAAGAPVAGASVLVAVYGNLGTPVTLAGENPVLTDEDGRATFTLTLDKAGGYRLYAVATLGGQSTAQIVTELFNVK